MADANNVIGQFKDEVLETTGEIAQGVKDSVGEMIEQGVQSAKQTPLTPQQIQQKQAEDQKKEMQTQKQITYTRKWLKDVEMAQAKVRMENQQKEQQRLQVQKQEEQATEIKKEEKKRQPVDPAIAYAGKAEIKRGVGG